jgi:hypothetical protein
MVYGREWCGNFESFVSVDFEAVLFADRGHGARIQEPREEILAEWDKRNIIEAL